MSRTEGPLESAFRSAEQAVWKHHGCAPTERRVRVERAGVDVRVLDFGEGEPVVFVHGGGGFATGWTPLLSGWTGGRAVAIDRPGCGLSDGFSYDGVDLRRHAVEVLEGVLDGMGIQRASLVGNSMGGLWSFWLAIDRPERVGRVVQLGCPALILDTDALFPMRLMSNRWLGEWMLRLEPPSPANARRLFDRLGHARTAIPDVLLAAGAANQALPTFAEGWLSLLGNALTIRGKRVGLTADDLRQVGQPVHFLWGSGDPFGAAEVGRRACELMPRATMDAIGTGHLPWLDEPERCRKALEAFLWQPAQPLAAGA